MHVKRAKPLALSSAGCPSLWQQPGPQVGHGDADPCTCCAQCNRIIGGERARWAKSVATRNTEIQKRTVLLLFLKKEFLEHIPGFAGWVVGSTNEGSAIGKFPLVSKGSLAFNS